MRVAIANWTARRAGGIESYLGKAVPALRRLGHEVFFWHEMDEPRLASLVEGVADGPASCVSTVGADESIRALARWQPDALFVHRVDHPDHERALLALAPGVFFAHAYRGTCISGTKTVRLPSVHACEREFGPMCLVQYFPRRCGGLSPLTMVKEYRRQSARLALLRTYGAIVTFSEHMRAEYVRHGIPAEHVHRLPAVDPMQSGFGDQQVHPLSALRKSTAGNSHDISRLAFIGRIDLLKGCAVLLNALPVVREHVKGRILVTIAGDGPDLPRCRDLAQKLATTLADVEITFLGWASEQQCGHVLETSDVLVMPSLWPEPYGLAGIEAQRRGVPVAAFAVGGIPEWLDDGKTGALAPAPPATPAGLATAILRCLASAEIRDSARARAGQDAWEYSIERHVAALAPLLGAVVARRRLSLPARDGAAEATAH